VCRLVNLDSVVNSFLFFLRIFENLYQVNGCSQVCRVSAQRRQQTPASFDTLFLSGVESSLEEDNGEDDSRVCQQQPRICLPRVVRKRFPSPADIELLVSLYISVHILLLALESLI
jgi:hypothetical protein